MNAPVGPLRTFAVEHRRLDRDRSGRTRPTPDAEAQLREVAAVMRNLPRDCFRDPAELVTLMRRLAGRLVKVADAGLEPAPATCAPRQPFIPQPRTNADGMFGAGGRVCRGTVGTVTSRKGRTVRVEIRRARAAGQFELGV